MSGSETGIMASREPFTVALQKTPPPAPQEMVFQNVRLSYDPDGSPSPVYKSIDELPLSSYHHSPPTTITEERPVLSQSMEFTGDQLRRKRGRPRKYGPENSMALALVPSSDNSIFGQSSGSFSPTSVRPPHSGPVSLSSFKKARGRPLGSVNKRRTESIGSTALGFTPHVITVKAGEDVSSKIMSFSQNGPRAVCILSANGAISNVTLRQPATSGGTVTYEGRFEILSLSGSFMLSEVGGQRSRTGGLSVSLAGQDGRVLGGSVSGLLTAASPVQVVVGSFVTGAADKEGSPGGKIEETGAASAPPRFHTPPPTTAGVCGGGPSVMTGVLLQSPGSPPSPPDRGLGPLGSPHTMGMTWK